MVDIKERTAIIESLECVVAPDNLSEDDFQDPIGHNGEGQKCDMFDEISKDIDEQKYRFYVIRKKDTKKIVFFFSLCCGLIVSTFVKPKQLFISRVSSFIFQCDLNMNIDIIPEIEKQYNNLYTDEPEFNNSLIYHSCADLINDRVLENNQSFNTSSTYGAIEMAHFCAVDSGYLRNKAFSPRWKMGEIMFWFFIVPKVLEIAKNIGCQYIYLYAANDSDSLKILSSYYKTALFFKKDDSGIIGAVKSNRTLNCEFLFQELAELRQRQLSFVDSFYIDNNDIIIA